MLDPISLNENYVPWNLRLPFAYRVWWKLTESNDHKVRNDHGELLQFRPPSELRLRHSITATATAAARQYIRRNHHKPSAVMHSINNSRAWGLCLAWGLAWFGSEMLVYSSVLKPMYRNMPHQSRRCSIAQAKRVGSANTALTEGRTCPTSVRVIASFHLVYILRYLLRVFV